MPETRVYDPSISLVATAIDILSAEIVAQHHFLVVYESLVTQFTNTDCTKRAHRLSRLALAALEADNIQPPLDADQRAAIQNDFRSFSTYEALSGHKRNKQAKTQLANVS